MRNVATNLLNLERRKFYSDWISQAGQDQRSLFRKANSLLGLHQQQPLPPHSDIAVLLQELSNLFVLKVNNIQPTIDSTNISSVSPSSYSLSGDSSIYPQHPFCEFGKLSDEDILSLIASGPNKSCKLDPVPTFLVKSSLHILAPIIGKIVNMSLSSGHFPSLFKLAIIHPKLKKPNLDPIFANYRALSNLTFLSKITEKAASHQVVSYLNSHNLFPRTQFVCRIHHSTETALLKVTNDILLNMNQKHVTLLVLLDLSSAFDTVDHTFLLTRLHTHFGICDTSLSWFKSYLSVRTPNLFPSGVQILPTLLNTASPRVLASVLFSSLFILARYLISLSLTSPTCTTMPMILKFIFLSRPILLHLRILLSLPFNPVSLISVLGLLTIGCLSMTPKLSSLIGTRQQLSKVHIDSISVGNSLISPSKYVKNLGTWFDNNLLMSTQISKVSSSCFTLSIISVESGSISPPKHAKLSSTLL